MSTSTPRRTGGRTLIDLDPGQLKWILLARESTLRERQLDHQLGISAAAAFTYCSLKLN